VAVRFPIVGSASFIEGQSYEVFLDLKIFSGLFCHFCIERGLISCGTAVGEAARGNRFLFF
jgi:hypothetical protein